MVKRLFLYAFIISVFLGDILVFRQLWTYGMQGLYHCMIVLFFVFLIIIKEEIPKENLEVFFGFIICYYCLLAIVMLNSWPYHDKMEYYKRNITFIFLMFTSTFPIIIISRNIVSENWLNLIFFAGGAAAFFTGVFILILRMNEVGNFFSAFRFQLDTIPAAYHMKVQKWTTDISETKLLFLNLKYVVYNQIGIRMVWGFIFISSYRPGSRKAAIIKKAIGSFLLIFVILSGSRESCLMLFLYLFLKSRNRKKLLLITVISAVVFIIYNKLSDIYFSEVLADVPILSRLNILFEFPKTLQNTRIDLWRDTLVLFKINPVMGIGPNGFILYSSGLLKSIVYNADNSILGLSVAFGIIGLAVITKQICRIVRYIFQNRNFTKDVSVRGLISGCSAYILTSIIAPHFMWPYSNLDAIFWLAVSLIILSINIKKINTEGPNAV